MREPADTAAGGAGANRSDGLERRAAVARVAEPPDAGASLPTTEDPRATRLARGTLGSPDAPRAGWLWRQRYTLISVATVVVLLVLWAVVTGLALVSPRVLPSPVALLSELGVLLTDGYAGKPLWVHVGASALRTSAGFLLGLLVGIPLGLLMGTNRVLSSVLSPVFAALRPIPPIAFIPLFILFFGIGEPPKVFLIFLVTLYYVVLNACAGVRLVPRALLLAGANQGLTSRQLFADIMLPAALPQIMTGIKTAVALSWGLVVAAELIAAQEGLGYLIADAGTFFRIPDVYLGILIIGAIGMLLEGLIVAAENRLLHWRGK